jgi:hypothetical protein
MRCNLMRRIMGEEFANVNLKRLNRTRLFDGGDDPAC